MNNINFTAEDLQLALNAKGWTGKILHVERLEDLPAEDDLSTSVFSVFYSLDPDYHSDDDYSTRDFVKWPDEQDILATDLEDAVDQILFPASDPEVKDNG